MLDKINSLIENTNYNTKVYVKDLRNNKDLINIGSGDQVVVTSLMYYPIFLTTCSLLYQRKISIKDEIQVTNPQNLPSFISEDGRTTYRLNELLQIMLIMNDSVAALSILKHIGPSKVNEFLVSEGFKNTSLANTSATTLQDMCGLFEKTFKRRFISPRMCDFSIDILHRSRETDMLKRLILGDVKIAQHSDSSRTSANACGIVLCEDIEYFIGISTYDSGNENPEVLKKHIGKISRLVHDNLSIPSTV